MPTVFFGHSPTASFAIASLNHPDSERVWCFQAAPNHPAVATRTLAGKGVTLDVQAASPA
ncbi:MULTISPECIES: hypothetical protein [Streptomyces]